LRPAAKNFNIRRIVNARSADFALKRLLTGLSRAFFRACIFAQMKPAYGETDETVNEETGRE